MHLLLRKSQRDDGWLWSSVVFILEARVELTPDEEELFERYQLADVVVYDSENRAYYAEASAESYLASSESFGSVPILIRGTSAEQVASEIASIIGGIAAGFWHLGEGMAYHAASALSLRITIGSLVEGHYLESESLEEVLALSGTIKASVEYLAAYFSLALTFDGREELDEY
jgi:hypothetical protein